MGPVVDASQHTGDERYEVVLRYEGEDLGLIYRSTPYGDLVTDRIVLVWSRPVGGVWGRVVSGRTGSRAEGRCKPHGGCDVRDLVGGSSHKELFDRQGHTLKSWTDRLPLLRAMVGDLESGLPD